MTLSELQLGFPLLMAYIWTVRKMAAECRLEKVELFGA